MSRETIREKLKTFICSELLGDPVYPLGEEESLIESGLIDSFAMAQFGVFVEQTFKLYIPDNELTASRLDTLKDMTDKVYEGVKSQRNDG